MIFAKPFVWHEGDPTRITLILDAMVARQGFLPYPYGEQEARTYAASILSDPGKIVFEVHRDREVVGVILLTRIVPKVDALLDFLMIDRDLVGKRKLLTNFLGYCFTELGFNRISAEVPEGARIERFFRKVLGFKLEGEARTRNPELPKSLSDSWVARQGSRREGACFDGTTWRDVVLLRLLASEWEVAG